MTLQMKRTCYIDPSIDYSEKRFEAVSTSSLGFSVARVSATYTSFQGLGIIARTERVTSSGQSGTTTVYKLDRSSYRWDVSSVSDMASGTLTSEFRGDGSGLYGIKDPRAQSGSSRFRDFSAWALYGAWDEEDYTSGGDYEDELYINNQAGANNPTDTDGTTHSYALTDEAITFINANSNIDIFFISENDLEGGIGPTSDVNNIHQRGYISGSYYDEDMLLVLTAEGEATVDNSIFFGANF